MTYTIKDEVNIINDMIIDVVDNVTQVTDVNPGSVIRTLIEAIAQEIYEQYEQLQNIYNGTRVLTATEDDLDDIGAIVGVTRLEGSKSQVEVTFQRESVGVSDFTISAGTIVSTQPNSPSGQYRFITLANATFDVDIPAETFTFNNGFYNYKLSERKIGSITALTGTASAAPYSFINATDYDIVEDFEGYLTDPTDITTIDDCEATTGWSASTDATAAATDAVNFKEGTKSLKLGKSGTTTTQAYYYKTLGATVDVTSKYVFFWVRLDDQATIDKLESMKIRISSDTNPTNNYYEFTIDDSELEVGWQYFIIDYTQSTNRSQTGYPNTDAIQSIRIEAVTDNTSDTFTSGKINMDFWFASDGEYYRGDIITFDDTGTLPDDATTVTSNWKPLSLDITCESEDIGEDYNSAQDTIIYKVSSITNINTINNYESAIGGDDEEIDDDYRERIQNAASAAGKATATALEQAILAVSGVQSVLVNDLPLKSATDEPLLYNSNVDEYKLNNEVAYLDDATSPTNILISDTVGGTADYTYGTDYELDTTTSVIDWGIGGTPPTTGNFVYIDYQYNWLGHVEIYVAGNSAPIPSSIQTLIDDAIEETKAAGVQVTWQEPTIDFINIESTVTVDTAGGYTEATVHENVQTATINWLNNFDIGEDVLVSEYIQLVMNVEGVTNVVITDWDGDTTAPFVDVSIGTSEVARPEDGGIVVN